jgi:hypothetical protein
MVPAWLLDMRPDGVELRVYCTLARFGRFDTAQGVYEECRPSIATLAEAAGLSESHTKRGLAGLLDKKAIERRLRVADDTKTSLPSVYRVIFGHLIGPPGEPPPSADGPLPPSAREPRGGPPADDNPEGSTQNQDTQKSAARKRATALPDDFAVTEQMRVWYAEKIGSAIDGLAEHEKFLDYYRANGRTHKDWPAAWRYWMRNALERAPRRRGAAPAAGGFQTAQERSTARVARAADLARIAEEYLERTGGNPEDPKQVNPIVAKLREHPDEVDRILAEISSASRTSGTYSEGKDVIQGEARDATREVTSYATERNPDGAR